MRFPFKLRDENDFDVVGFGTNAVDHLIRVPKYPAFNSKIEFIDHVIAPGGEVASTMVGLSRLGVKTAYVGRVGDDEEGELLLEGLKKERVDAARVEVIAGAKTQLAFIIIDEQTGERTIIWHRDERLAYSKSDVPIDLCRRARILHVTPHDTEACIRMAEAATDTGVIVSGDFDNVVEGIERLLPLIDICIVSADLPGKLMGIADKHAALSEMRSRYGCSVVGATLGAAGSIILCGDEMIETPGFAVPGGCVDTTGAGDAYRVGFLFGVLSGETVKNSALMANAVAALKCRGVGAWTALPDKYELETLIKKL